MKKKINDSQYGNNTRQATSVLNAKLPTVAGGPPTQVLDMLPFPVSDK